MSDKPWKLLDAPAPKGCEGVQDLYAWSLNYDPGAGPFALFCDLIGWSADNLGEALYRAQYPLGWIEADKLARALSEYANRPISVRAYIDELIESEME